MLDKLIWFVYTNNIVKREREKMVKVKIIKNTWGHSKKCWYIIDIENNISLNYTGHTSKKAALKVVEAIKGMELVG